MKKLIYSILSFYILIMAIDGMLINLDSYDSQKILAKKYDVPMDLIQYNIKVKWGYFPIKHDIFYVTTDRGEDITLFTSYLGIKFFNDDNIDKYLGLNSLKDELKSRGYYEWAE